MYKKNRLEYLMLRLQKINETHLGIVEIEDYPKDVQMNIHKIGDEIKRRGLLDSYNDRYFAEQILMKNNVPEEYWREK